MTEIYDSEDLATFSTGLGPDETLTKAHLAELPKNSAIPKDSQETLSISFLISSAPV